jgi:Holin of 3TMs, for gene-transfer release
MAEEQQPEKKDEDWMQKKWRPAMGWMYMGICTLDMAVFPVLWSVLQVVQHTTITQWQPLTLQGAGLFHVAMGAVLGIAAFGRTQEKLAGAAVNPTASGTPLPVAAPAPMPASAPPPAAPAAVTSGFNGKKAPPEPAFPEI